MFLTFKFYTTVLIMKYLVITAMWKKSLFIMLLDYLLHDFIYFFYKIIEAFFKKKHCITLFLNMLFYSKEKLSRILLTIYSSR